MNCVSLFAGIGGFDLGFERAGIKTVAVVEQDGQCRELLEKRFPHAAQFDDVNTVGKSNLTKADIVCGGFPCQDVSVAGARRGLAGDRTGLFYQLTRITDELRPAFLVWENVPGLFSSNDGRDFLAVLTELDRIGYHGAWRVLDAQFFGVAQRRRRIFGVFARADIGASRCAEVLSLAQGVRWNPPPSRETGKGIARPITPGSQNGSGYRNDADTADNLIPDLAGTIAASGAGTARACGNNNQADQLITEVADCLQERDSKGSVSNTKNGHLIPIAFDSTQITSRTNRSQPRAGEPCHTLAKGQHAPTIAFNARQDPDSWSDRTGPLDTDGTTQAIAFSGRNRGAEPKVNRPERAPHAMQDKVGALDTTKPWNVAFNGVRRLTPKECERLQGFPDDWTAGFADSVRYRMLGNAVAVPCAEWIGRRLNLCNPT